MRVKAFRSLFAVILSCVIAWNGFASPAFAASDSVGSFINGFWYAVGGIVGGATGTVVTCYTVDVLIASVAPPVAVYLAPMCATTGAVGGFGGGLAWAKAIAGAH